MKKLFIIAGLVAVASLTSCKKDYECSASFLGEKEVLSECLDCSKSDAEDMEETWQKLVDADLQEEGLPAGTVPVSCDKK